MFLSSPYFPHCCCFICIYFLSLLGFCLHVFPKCTQSPGRQQQGYVHRPPTTPFSARRQHIHSSVAPRKRPILRGPSGRPSGSLGGPGGSHQPHASFHSGPRHHPRCQVSPCLFQDTCQPPSHDGQVRVEPAGTHCAPRTRPGLTAHWAPSHSLCPHGPVSSYSLILTVVSLGEGLSKSVLGTGWTAFGRPTRTGRL